MICEEGKVKFNMPLHISKTRMRLSSLKTFRDLHDNYTSCFYILTSPYFMEIYFNSPVLVASEAPESTEYSSLS